MLFPLQLLTLVADFCWFGFRPEIFFVLDAASYMLDLYRQMTSFTNAHTCEAYALVTMEQSHYIC